MKTKVKKSTTLWNKAGKALQAFYRSKYEPCLGCGAQAQVMHHHAHWSRSLALRLEEINLVSLCQKCHMAHHNGVLRVKINYERTMRDRWGQDWEDQLMKIDREWLKKSAPDLRDYIQDKIKLYGE